VGQSAGASSIVHHITAGGGRSFQPSFQKAVIQSPGFVPSPNATQDDETYKQFLNLTGAKDLESLFEADASVLMKANADLTYKSSYGLFKFGPTVDGFYVPDLPSKLLKDGRFWRGTSLLVGHTKYDGLVFTPPWIRSNEQLRQHVRTMYPGITESVLDEIDRRYPIEKWSFAKEKLIAVSDFLDVRNILLFDSCKL